MGEPTLKTAILCSRLGIDVQRIARVTRWIGRAAMEIRQQRGSVLVGKGTAAEPLVRHAAGLFQIPLVELDGGSNVDRDVVAAADRIVVTYCRKGGKVASLVAEAIGRGVLVKVVVCGQKDTAAGRLIERGAIGWFAGEKSIAESNQPAWQAIVIREGQLLPGGDWLVHCTRGCPGPWPGQSIRQYRDELMLGGPDAERRGPIDVLRRIIRSGRLVGGAVASKGDTAVVCFSNSDPGRLLRRRAYRSHLKRWDYLPYGIAVAKAAARAAGIRAVQYVDRSSQATDPWWSVASGTAGRWREENEWRGAGSLELGRLDAKDVCVFVPGVHDAAMLEPETTQRGWRVVTVGEDPDAGISELSPNAKQDRLDR